MARAAVARSAWRAGANAVDHRRPARRARQLRQVDRRWCARRAGDDQLEIVFGLHNARGSCAKWIVVRAPEADRRGRARRARHLRKVDRGGAARAASTRSRSPPAPAAVLGGGAKQNIVGADGGTSRVVVGAINTAEDGERERSRGEGGCKETQKR